MGGDIFAEADYVCPDCGEEIVVPLDVTEGVAADYIEDCPVCCRPNRLRVDWVPGEEPRISAEPA
ncbi:MAG: CPXCG motif-containing cysteine-rich protein [Planctomycetota bacterium]